MKKMLVSLFIGVTLIATHTTAEASSLKPSTIKDGVKTYKAVLTKNVKVYDYKHNKAFTMKKGKDITIVEKIEYGKYHLLVLKGQIYTKANDKAIKIKKSVKGTTAYHNFKLSKLSKDYLKQLGTKHKDYKEYRKYLIQRDEAYRQSEALLLRDLIDMNLYTNQVMGTGMGGDVSQSYDYWVVIGKPEGNTNIRKTWITQ